MLQIPFYFFINSCDATLKEFLQSSFPTATVTNDANFITIEGTEYSVDYINVQNMDEVSNCLQLYKIDKN